MRFIPPEDPVLLAELKKLQRDFMAVDLDSTRKLLPQLRELFTNKQNDQDFRTASYNLYQALTVFISKHNKLSQSIPYLFKKEDL